jgi:hypothetical protein
LPVFRDLNVIGGHLPYSMTILIEYGDEDGTLSWCTRWIKGYRCAATEQEQRGNEQRSLNAHSVLAAVSVFLGPLL